MAHRFSYMAAESESPNIVLYYGEYMFYRKNINKGSKSLIFKNQVFIKIKDVKNHRYVDAYRKI